MLKPFGTFFEVQPIAPWPVSSNSEQFKEDWQNDQDNKKLLGIELAKGQKPLDAGLKVFPEDANKALWVAHNWISDPVVIGAKDQYVEIVENKSSLLDKDRLSVKLLDFADEKDATGRFYINEAKDRLAALKLYAEVQGFTGKVDINASTNNITNNKLELILVGSPKKAETTKVIDAEPIAEIKNRQLPSNLKLVSTK